MLKTWSITQPFFFTCKNNLNLNYNIIIYIMYIDNTLVLHLVDKARYFQAS